MELQNITIKRNNDEYTFSYAFLVSIQKNRPARTNFVNSIMDIDNKPTDEEQCDYLLSMVDKEIVFSTVNEFTDTAVSGVNLTITCGRYTCPIGETDTTVDNHGSVASITSNLLMTS